MLENKLWYINSIEWRGNSDFALDCASTFEISSVGPWTVVIVLIGNKLDLPNRQVALTDASTLTLIPWIPRSTHALPFPKWLEGRASQGGSPCHCGIASAGSSCLRRASIVTSWFTQLVGGPRPCQLCSLSSFRGFSSNTSHISTSFWSVMERSWFCFNHLSSVWEWLEVRLVVYQPNLSR